MTDIQKNIKFKCNLKSISTIVILFFVVIVNLSSQVPLSIEEKLKLSNYRQEIMNLSILDSSSDFIFNTMGIASYYGKKFHNRKTASGEIFNMNEYTAAHRTLPFGTILKVTNIQNKKSVLVRINDRGPFIGSRILDLSYEAANKIESTGLPTVTIEGFIPKNADFDVKNIDEYIFGYSLNYPLICLHKSVVSYIAMTKSFNEAVKILMQFTERHPGIVSYLLLPASQLLKSNKNDDIFYIAMILPEKAVKMKEFVNILK